MSDKIQGTVRELGGKAKDAVGRVVGRVTGDSKLQAEGLIDEAAGAVQRNYGVAREAAEDGLQALSEAVRDRPLAAIIIALGVGWLLGRLRIV
jgi:uncharacterized protein YjbJ (UPF0337 family)